MLVGVRHHEGDLISPRYEQLDGLRAVAVMGVVVCHTLDPQRHGWSQNGAFGVQLFFVLSGFLITGILLDARRDAAAADVSRRTVLGSFYARRGLRIVPAYYVTLAVATFLGVQGMRQHLGWNIAYLSNWRVASDGEFGAATHIWSLAVEEQFYLVWPLVVLFAPRRILPWVFGGTIAIALATRVILTAATDLWADGIAILTPSVLDSLGLGAMLALLWRNSPNANRLINWLGGLALVLWAVDLAVNRWGPSRSSIGAVTVVWWSLAFVWLVHRAATGRTGPLGRILTLRPLAYLGMISYGVYLVHLFVVPSAKIVEEHVGIDLLVPVERGPLQLVVVTAASVAVAAVMWTFLERPINRNKHHFPYVRRRTAT